MIIGPSTNLCSIGRGADAGIIAVGDGGTILVLQGDKWIAINTGTAANINAIWGGPKECFCRRSKAYILRLIEAKSLN